MAIVTMATKDYVPYIFSFYNSIRSKNKDKIYCYLINCSEFREYLQLCFEDVVFREYNGKFNKWKGLECVNELKPIFLKEVLESEEEVIWIDVAKIVLKELDFIKKELNNFEMVRFIRENETRESFRYFGGIYAYSKRGEYLIDKQIKICLGGAGDWIVEQKSLYFLEGKIKDLNYFEYVSRDYDPSFFMVRNYEIGNTKKNDIAPSKFTDILSGKIEDYAEKYNLFLMGLPKDIVAYIHEEGSNWCFMTSVKQLQKKFNFRIVVGDEKIGNPDIIYCRGGIYLMDHKLEKKPELAKKVISTISTGGELLDCRIKKSLKWGVKSKGFIVQNQEARTRLKYFLEKEGITIPIYLLPNSVDLELFKPEKKPDQFIVGFAGRTSDRDTAKLKGFHLVEMACDILKIPLKICSNTDLLRIAHKDMPNFYNSISCLILPSDSEGHSNTILEAQACGLPVICTPVGYHGETCTDGKELLFCRREVNNIIEKIMFLMNKEARDKIGKNAREYAEKYSIEQIYPTFEEIFKTKHLNSS